jgi:GMP synthase (glutamine-hydrolysing)
MTQFAVLDASLGETPAQRNVDRELDGETTGFEVSEGEFPPEPTGDDWSFDGVVISGSQSSVYDDRDWIHRLTDWFRRAHADGVPALGICWGHQFIAQALGGRVADMGEYELGYRSSTHFGDDALFAGVPATFTAFETHSDRVVELPPGASKLAENDVGVQAFRVGSAFGVQFHPEYDLETARSVTREKDLPQERIDAVLEGITESAYEEARAATGVFDNFRRFVERRRTATSTR